MTGEKWGKPTNGVDLLPDNLAETISEWVASADDWEKRKIEGLPGLFLVRMPEKANTPVHAGLEINPADQFGNPTKRRGIYIRTTAEMQAVADLFGGKIPKQIMKLCTAVFGEGAAPMDAGAEGMLVITE